MRWLACYTLVLTALYALIPYKTPWCMLSFLQGLVWLAGVGGWTIVRAVPTVVGKSAAGLLLAAGLAHLGWECYALNFDVRLAADQRNPYVYAHTSTDVLNLARQMDRLAAVSPEGRELVIHVVTPQNYWPLPWYLRQFDRDRIGFWQDPAVWRQETAGLPAPSVIMLTGEVDDAVAAAFPTGYNRQMLFGLRPGVLLSVWVRDDLWKAFVDAM